MSLASCTYKHSPQAPKGRLCCRKVIVPKDLAESEDDRLEDGRMKRSTVARICENETEIKPDILLHIMEKFDMLIPYKGRRDSSGTSVDEYLVPCMMKRVPEGKVPQPHPEVKDTPILYFKFVHRDKEEGVFLPHGLFHRLISRCCQTNEKLEIGAIYYDYIEFSTDKVVFYLRMAYDSILLCVIQRAESYETEDQRRETLSNLRHEIESLIDAVLQSTCPNLTCVHYLECMSKEHKHRYSTMGSSSYL